MRNFKGYHYFATYYFRHKGTEIKVLVNETNYQHQWRLASIGSILTGSLRRLTEYYDLVDTIGEADLTPEPETIVPTPTCKETQGPTCPDCGVYMIPIAYGYPSHLTTQASRRGELILGGCIIRPGNPKHHCKKCNKSC